MNFWDTLINGMVAGLGMTIVMTIFSGLTFFFLKPWITKTVSDIWSKVRDANLQVEVKIDGKEKE